MLIFQGVMHLEDNPFLIKGSLFDIPWFSGVFLVKVLGLKWKPWRITKLQWDPENTVFAPRTNPCYLIIWIYIVCIYIYVYMYGVPKNNYIYMFIFDTAFPSNWMLSIICVLDLRSFKKTMQNVSKIAFPQGRLQPMSRHAGERHLIAKEACFFRGSL